MALPFMPNPVWNSLTTSQAEFALWYGDAVRYPAEIAPFCAVQDDSIAVDVTQAMEHGDICFVGVIPRLRGGSYEVQTGMALQMMFVGSPEESPDAIEGEAELTMEQSDEMVELIELAYPGYFRRSTPRLGRYIGIREEGLLIAMAGERMRPAGFCEISGVCTRPGYTGRGYASHLVRRLLRRDGELRSFLHVDRSNERAIAIYQALGFQIVGELELLHLSPG